MLTRNNNDFFTQLPQVDMQRSHFPRPHTVKTTFNSSDLIPLAVYDILPGDTVSLDLGFVVRQATPIHPVMDNANFETFWFFVPNRLIWDDFEHFITGGLDAGHWDAPREIEHPMIRAMTVTENGNSVRRGFPFKSVADYMGIPVGPSRDENGSVVDWPDVKVNALPFRAYAKIWNDWFRSSSLQEEVLIPTESNGTVDSPVVGTWRSDGSSDTVDQDFSTCVYGGKLLKANRYHDYFSSALPEPQRGEPVGVPIDLGMTPVVTGPISEYANSQTFPGLRIAGSGYLSSDVLIQADGFVGNTKTGDLTWNVDAAVDPASNIRPVNLWANFTDQNNSAQISINDLRHAVAVQHILEIDARSGSGRYIDLLRGHFGVTSPDARLQRSEYLGGTSTPINMEQVLQTSSTNEVSPQGNTAAFSLTSGVNETVTKSFVEHGILMCVGCVRHVHSYQQGLEKMWSREDRYDYYWPALANISEQAILNKEIYATGTAADDEVFGYQEAWSEYRYKPSIVTGAMRSTYPQSLDVWHYADYYREQPFLSADWLLENPSEIDRTLAVSSSLEDQFIADIAIHGDWFRVLPVYSVPGLDRM